MYMHTIVTFLLENGLKVSKSLASSRTRLKVSKLTLVNAIIVQVPVTVYAIKPKPP